MEKSKQKSKNRSKVIQSKNKKEGFNFSKKSSKHLDNYILAKVASGEKVISTRVEGDKVNFRVPKEVNKILKNLSTSSGMAISEILKLALINKSPEIAAAVKITRSLKFLKERSKLENQIFFYLKQYLRSTGPYSRKAQQQQLIKLGIKLDDADDETAIYVKRSFALRKKLAQGMYEPLENICRIIGITLEDLDEEEMECSKCNKKFPNKELRVLGYGRMLCKKCWEKECEGSSNVFVKKEKDEDYI